MSYPIKSRFADHLIKLGFVKYERRETDKSTYETYYEEMLDIFSKLPPRIRTKISEPPLFFVVVDPALRTWAIDETGEAWLCKDKTLDLTPLGFSTMLEMNEPH